MLSSSDTFAKSLGDGEVVVVEANGDNRGAISKKGSCAAKTKTQPDTDPCPASSLEAGNAFEVS